jgi:SAM-dependent methyltransferase
MTPCPICAREDAVEVPCIRRYTGGWPLHVCSGCGLVHARERRPAEEIARLWSEELFGESPDPRSVLYQPSLPAITARLTYVAELLDRQVGFVGRRLADIGAGKGQLLDLAKSRGASTFGIEPSSTHCHRLRERGHGCHEGTIETFGGEARFDVVTIAWTLENTSDPRAMLGGARRMLAAGGRLLVATGSRILVPFKKPLDYYLGQGNPDIHPFHFSAATLRAILAVGGFRVTYVNSFIDSDVLAMIAEAGEAEAFGDAPAAVLAFFERWDRETAYYL